MEPLLESIVKEVPSLSALVILVWLFLRDMHASRQQLADTLVTVAATLKENSAALHEVCQVLGRSKEMIEYLDRRKKDTPNEQP